MWRALRVWALDFRTQSKNQLCAEASHLCEHLSYWRNLFHSIMGEVVTFTLFDTWSFLIIRETFEFGKYLFHYTDQFSSVSQSCLTLCDSHGPQHGRPPCPSPPPGVYPNSSPLSQWCHPTISSSVIPFSSCPLSFPASGSFQMSKLFASGGQSIGVSASTSVLPMNAQDWFPLGWTGWISLQSRGLSRVFSNTTVQKHQFFSAQLSL